MSRLQEEVMEFEIKDLEIIDHQSQTNAATAQRTETNTSQSASSNSLILNELYKENDELQNKIKLNYRRLLLFEAENNKLVEEKNKLFFEAQSYRQKNEILEEKNDELEKKNIFAHNNQKLLNEKVSSLENINKTQLSEIRRFSKFHNKIQEVVKPYIVQLKKQISELTQELSQTQTINANLTTNYREFLKKAELEMTQKTNEITNLQIEKNALIRTYEEQIHSFSKEILDLQARNESSEKEIQRLRKAVEFKNYYENEVIRFKRTHEEDQARINDLTQKKSAAEARVLSLEEQAVEMKQQTLMAQTQKQDLESSLEMTRDQLAKKIDEIATLNERLARFEKLNNQLSLEMASKHQS